LTTQRKGHDSCCGGEKAFPERISVFTRGGDSLFFLGGGGEEKVYYFIWKEKGLVSTVPAKGGGKAPLTFNSQ